MKKANENDIPMETIREKLLLKYSIILSILICKLFNKLFELNFKLNLENKVSMSNIKLGKVEMKTLI